MRTIGISIALSCALLISTKALACTNVIVGREASVDGSVMCSYSADSYGAFMQMAHYPAAKHAPGTMRKIYDWDTNHYWGEIPEAPETYNVLGNINEWQVAIAETTFGGREEMVDTTGIMDYGSLIYVALQRSRTAREALKVMTTLAETYGYNSEGETFTICDPREAWIMEMIGPVWVAQRIPDNAICAHANQSRIRTFNQHDPENVLFSTNCISYAREHGWYEGSDEDFSFRDAYAAPDFSGRRACEARVWSIFNHYADMTAYVDYAAGKKALSECEEMPLWIIPETKLSVQDVESLMRDHYEGTPFDLTDDLGEGLWQMPYRPTPLFFTGADGKKYFNERPVSTQQSAFTFVAQLRAWLPREIGGLIWFGNDDAKMVPFLPVYCGNAAPPACFNDPVADDITFSENSAFWVCNWVSNMVYPRYAQMFKTLESERQRFDQRFAESQAEVERHAIDLFNAQGPAAARDYLTTYSNTLGEEFLTAWKQFAVRLIVKYNDMCEKPEDENGFLRNSEGLGATVVRTGYPERTMQRLINSSGERFVCPTE